MPAESWQTFSFYVVSPEDADTVRATLQVGSSQSEETILELRNTWLTDSQGRSAEGRVNIRRSQLWFSHPNLAAHTVASVGLAALSLSGTVGATLSVAALSLPLLVVTGSRAAVLAFLFGATWILGLFWPPRLARVRLRRKPWFVTALVLGLVLAMWLLTQSDALFSRGEASRSEIWQAAIRAALEQPWRGAPFTEYWQANYSHLSTERVMHAHNLWLELAASYGLPGLLTILWLTGGIGYLAWTWGRWRALALVSSILLMNFFDYTFFYSGVLIPLILGMNALRHDRQRCRRSLR